METPDSSARFADRSDWWRLPPNAAGDYQVARYDIAREPMLREIDGGWISRNRYGAACINSAILFAVDIDFRTDDDTIACRDFVRELYRHQDMSAALRIEPLRLVEARLREVLADPVGEKARRLGAALVREGTEDLGDAAVATFLLDRLGYFQGLGFRLYESRNGFRVICSSTVFGLRTDAEKAVAGHLQERLLCDRAYSRICAEQGLFRLRLTPKPWRTDDGTGKAARYVGTYGSEKIEPRLEALIAEHDRVACVDQFGRADAVLA